MERVFGISIDDKGSVKKLNDLDKGFDKLSESSKKADGRVRDANGRFVKSSESAGKANKSLISLNKTYLTTGIVAAAATKAVLDSVRSFTQFESAIAEVNTLLGDNQQIGAYTESVRELSKQFGTSNVEQAQAFYQVISAGASSATEATNILTAANKLAIGGVTDIKTAADGLTSILNAYSLSSAEAGKVSDILFATMRSGKTTIGELSSSIGKVAPLASQLGVGFDELTAALATITTNGVNTKEAVTQVRAALANVLKPSAEATELAGKLGINFSTAGLQAEGLAGFLDTVSTATGGSADQLATLFGSVEAVQAVMPLAGAQAEKFSEILDKNKNSAGETERAYEILAETTQKNFDRLQAKVQDLATSFGGFLAPAVNLGIDALEGIVTVVSFAGEGLGLLLDLLVDLSSSFASLVGIDELWKRWNSELDDSNSFLSNIAETFQNVDTVRARFIEGVLVGWEEIKFATQATGALIERVFGQAFDAVLRGVAAPIEFLRDGLDLAGFETAAAQLNGFAKSVKGSQDSVEKFDKKLLDLRKEADENIGTIKEITGDMFDFAVSSNETAEEVDKLADSAEELGEATKDAGDKIELTTGQIDAVKGAIKAATDEVARYTKATGGDLIRSQTEMNRVLDEAQLKTQNYAKALADAEALLTQPPRSLVKGTDEYNEALKVLGFSIDDAGEKTSVLGGIWEETTESMFGALEGFFREGLDGWDSFTDSIENIFKDMIASLLAQWAASGIIGLFNGEGFSGFSLGNAFGDGSGNFNLGGLFGGESSQSAVGAVFGQSAGQSFSSAVGGVNGASGIYGGVNQIDQGLEQGGSSGALSVASGAASIYRGYGQLAAAYNALFGGGSAGVTAGVNAVTSAANSVAAASQGVSAGVNAVTGAANAAAAANASAATTAGVNAGVNAVTGSAQTISGGGGAAVGSAAAATAGWIGVGLILDEYIGNRRVQNGFSTEFDIRRDATEELFDSGLEGIIKSSFQDGSAILTGGLTGFSDFGKSFFEAPLASLERTFGGRGEDELGSDQFDAVLKALEEGRTQAVDAGNGVNFLGGFNDDGVFFESSLNAEQLDQVGQILKDSGLADASKAIGDGVLRVAGEGLNFSENNVEIVQQVKDAIAEVATTITAAESDIIGSMSNAFDQTGKSANSAFVEIDKAFDLIDDTTLSSSEKLAVAYSQAFDTTIEKGNEWVASSELSADRFTQIFDAASGKTLNSVLGFTDASAEAIEGLGDSGKSAADGMESAISQTVGGLIGKSGELDSSYQAVAQSIVESFSKSSDSIVGIYDGLDLGTPRPVTVTVNTQNNTTQSKNNSGGLSDDAVAIVDELRQTNRESKLLRASLDVNGNR